MPKRSHQFCRFSRQINQIVLSLSQEQLDLIHE